MGSGDIRVGSGLAAAGALQARLEEKDSWVLLKVFIALTNTPCKVQTPGQRHGGGVGRTRHVGS